MNRTPKIGDRVALASSRDVFIVDEVLRGPDRAVLRLNGMPTHVQTVPWAALIYPSEGVNQAAVAAGINSDGQFFASVKQDGAPDRVRLSVRPNDPNFDVTPPAIYGSSKDLRAAVDNAGLEKRNARSLTEAINKAATDGYTIMCPIPLEITPEQLKALGFERVKRSQARTPA
jgi:hypothetical protein